MALTKEGLFAGQSWSGTGTRTWAMTPSIVTAPRLAIFVAVMNNDIVQNLSYGGVSMEDFGNGRYEQGGLEFHIATLADPPSGAQNITWNHQYGQPGSGFMWLLGGDAPVTILDSHIDKGGAGQKWPRLELATGDTVAQGVAFFQHEDDRVLNLLTNTTVEQESDVFWDRNMVLMHETEPQSGTRYFGYDGASQFIQFIAAGFAVAEQASVKKRLFPVMVGL